MQRAVPQQVDILRIVSGPLQDDVFECLSFNQDRLLQDFNVFSFLLLGLLPRPIGFFIGGKNCDFWVLLRHRPNKANMLLVAYQKKVRRKRWVNAIPVVFWAEKYRLVSS